MDERQDSIRNAAEAYLTHRFWLGECEAQVVRLHV